MNICIQRSGADHLRLHLEELKQKSGIVAHFKNLRPDTDLLKVMALLVLFTFVNQVV